MLVPVRRIRDLNYHERLGVGPSYLNGTNGITAKWWGFLGLVTNQQKAFYRWVQPDES